MIEGQLVRIYKRASKSPWDDDTTTVLLLADLTRRDLELNIGYQRYIYLHRNEQGKALGLSLSATLAEELGLEDVRYAEGELMYAVLLYFKKQIIEFCSHFTDEFEQLFLAAPSHYFSVMESYWQAKLESF